MAIGRWWGDFNKSKRVMTNRKLYTACFELAQAVMRKEFPRDRKLFDEHSKKIDKLVEDFLLSTKKLEEKYSETGIVSESFFLQVIDLLGRVSPVYIFDKHKWFHYSIETMIVLEHRMLDISEDVPAGDYLASLKQTLEYREETLSWFQFGSHLDEIKFLLHCYFDDLRKHEQFSEIEGVFTAINRLPKPPVEGFCSGFVMDGNIYTIELSPDRLQISKELPDHDPWSGYGYGGFRLESSPGGYFRVDGDVSGMNADISFALDKLDIGEVYLSLEDYD